MKNRAALLVASAVCLFVALTLAATPGLAQQACSGITNPSFETGSFAGWASLGIGNSAVITNYMDLNFAIPQTVKPFFGKYQARLTPDPAAGNNVAAIETFLGVLPGFFSTQALDNGVAIAQAFHLEAGDQIRIAYYWAGRDYLPFNDAAFITLLEPSPFPLPTTIPITKAKVWQIASLAEYGSAYLPGISGAPFDPGNSFGQGSSGYLVWPVASWTEGPQPWAAISTKGFSYTAPVAGDYVMGVAAFNSEDTELPPDLLVDALTCVDPPVYVDSNAHH